MTQNLDYHVGLLRGYILAHNAPTQILHALDHLLTGYKSRAGELIAHPKPQDVAAERAKNAENSSLNGKIHTPEDHGYLATPLQQMEDRPSKATVAPSEEVKPLCNYGNTKWTDEMEEVIIKHRHHGASAVARRLNEQFPNDIFSYTKVYQRIKKMESEGKFNAHN